MAEDGLLFDRALLRRRRARAALLGPATFLMDRVAAELADRLAAIMRRFALAADIGSPTAAVGRALRSSAQVDTLIGVAASDRLGQDAGPTIRADEEALPFKDAALDLVVSALGLQFVNDLPGTLLQIRRALKPDGLFLAAFLGEATLTELRQAFAAAESEIEGGLSPRVAPFVDVRTLGGLLQRAGFALPVVDRDTLTARYDSAFALMQDLRRMGATNVLIERRRTPLRRATLMRAAEIYAARFADQDRRSAAPIPRDWSWTRRR